MNRYDFPPNVDIWLVWSRGLRDPTASLGHSSPGKPLFQTRHEKARHLSKHLLKLNEHDLPMATLINLYPAPKTETAE